MQRATSLYGEKSMIERDDKKYNILEFRDISFLPVCMYITPRFAESPVLHSPHQVLVLYSYEVK